MVIKKQDVALRSNAVEREIARIENVLNRTIERCYTGDGGWMGYEGRNPFSESFSPHVQKIIIAELRRRFTEAGWNFYYVVHDGVTIIAVLNN